MKSDKSKEKESELLQHDRHIADMSIRNKININQQEINHYKHQIRSYIDKGKIASATALFETAYAKFPTIGKYKYCNSCGTKTPHIDNKCIFCGSK